MLIGMMIGIAAVAGVTVRYGQYWFESLHGELSVPAHSGAGGLTVGDAIDPPGGAPGPVPVDTTPAVVPGDSPATAAAGDSGGNIPPATEALPWSSFSEQALPAPVTGDFPWRDCFRRAAAAYQLPEALLLAVARGESGFDASARSERDAIGVMQIRWPLTAKHLGILRERELYDPCVNIDAGARYLRELLDRYADDYHLALAAYNYGPSRVKADQVPAAAGDYSRYIWRQLQAVLDGSTTRRPPVTPEPASTAGGRTLVMRFDQVWHARAFEQFLRDTVPGVQLATEVQPRGDHAVYLSWTSPEQRRQVQSIAVAQGLPPMSDTLPQSSNLSEQRHAF
jgi:hypothetical protein